MSIAGQYYESQVSLTMGQVLHCDYPTQDRVIWPTVTQKYTDSSDESLLSYQSSVRYQKRDHRSMMLEVNPESIDLNLFLETYTSL